MQCTELSHLHASTPEPQSNHSFISIQTKAFISGEQHEPGETNLVEWTERSEWPSKKGRAMLVLGIADLRTLSKANYCIIPCGANVCKVPLAFYELY